MNARSLRDPSPFISPPTRGENGWPDENRITDVTSTHGRANQFSDPVNECFRSRSLRPDCTSFGSPPVVADPTPNPNPPRPPPPPMLAAGANAVWSRECIHVYDMFQI